MKIKATRGTCHDDKGGMAPALIYWDETDPENKRAVTDSPKSALLLHVACRGSELPGKDLPGGWRVECNPEVPVVTLGR